MSATFPDEKDYILICDIGGTHARLAYADAAAPYIFHGAEKFETTAFSGLDACIDYYTQNLGLAPAFLKKIMIASAVRPQNGIVQFDTTIKTTNWRIDPQNLAAHCMLPASAVQILLDTEAQFSGIEERALTPDHMIRLKPISGPLDPETAAGEILVSIGTGLGHAVKNAQNGAITPTFGGHMMPAAVTQEQWDTLCFIKQYLNTDALIYEDVVSGRGLYNLYRYACHSRGTAPAAEDMTALARDICTLKDHPEIQMAARLFSEYLGLYIHMLCLSTHSYRRTTLIGGILRQLHELGLLDVEAIKKHIELPRVTSVQNHLNAMPVDLILKEHLSLWGLMNIYSNDNEI